MSPAPVGVQMYTVDAQAEADYPGTLRRLAGLGYRGVELYGLHGHSPGEIRKAADDVGLVLSSSHAAFPAGPDARRILDEAAALGVPTLTWSLEADELETVDKIARGSERVNEGAANAAGYGIEIAYHNHWAEFINSFDGRSAYSVLWDHLDPAVLAEVDMYWVQLGGANPAAVLADLGERACYLHVKDGPADDPRSLLVPVGTGRLDIPATLAAAPYARWHLVELECCAGDVFDVLEQSYRYLVDNGLSEGQGQASQPAQ